MAGNSTQNPLLLLREIERRSRVKAAGLPQQQEAEEQWSGIGFRIGNLQLLAPLGQVSEIMTIPAMSRVPGTKSWVLGIANVRGNLLPIMDLAGYLYGRRTVLTKRSRALVVSHRGVFAGLLVDEVMGLRHFPEENRISQMPRTDVAVVPYLDRGYRVGDESWLVFSMRKLAESPLFLQVAV
jgi:twitching motility protein PilI